MNKSGISLFAVTVATLLAFSTADSSRAVAAETTGAAPVEFTYDGVAPDKETFTYKIKVNTDKPIKEVHLKLKQLDAGGKVVDETTLVWQNVVKSVAQPIEQGKTYEAHSTLDSGAVKAECSLAEVIFADSTRWKPTASVAEKPSAMAAALAPPKEPAPATESAAPKTSDRQASIQAEVESFIKSVYRDMEQDDPARVLASFADVVDYYSYGPQTKAAIAEQLRKYFATYPTRTFTVGEVKLEGPPSKSRKVTAIFEVRYSLKDAQGTTSTGHSKAELDLVKPDKLIKIVRFNGTSVPD